MREGTLLLARVGTGAHGWVTNVDSVTRWELLRALRIAVDTANEEPLASAPTREGAMAVCEAFALRVAPAFGRALDAGIAKDECWEAFGPDGPAIRDMMNTWEADLRRAETEARRVDAEIRRATVGAAPPVDASARHQALRALSAVAEAPRAIRDDGAAIVTAVGNAVNAGVPIEVALDVLERHGVQIIEALGISLASSDAPVADADLRTRPAILLPAPGPEHTGSAVAARADAGPRSAHPTPEPIPDAGDFEADLRNIDAAAAALWMTVSEPMRRAVAGMVNQARNLARRRMERDARPRRALGSGRILRRARAPRARRRAAHRSAIAPMRDGPPPSDDAPAPVAGCSPRSALGGAR